MYAHCDRVRTCGPSVSLSDRLRVAWPAVPLRVRSVLNELVLTRCDSPHTRRYPDIDFPADAASRIALYR